MFAGLTLTLFCCLPNAQDPAGGQVVARFRNNGQEATVTATDLALEMAFHLRRKDEGRAACEQLVGARLVKLAAEQQHLTASDEEARNEWLELQRQLRGAGRSPKTKPIVRNSSEAELLAYFSVPVLLRKLVRAELAMKPSENVGGEMMQLWLQEARKQRQVVDDPELLPIGTAARIGTEPVSMLDLGLLLLRTSSEEQRDHFVRQVVVLQATESLALQLKLSVTPEELQRQLELRREDAAADPRFQGLAFEQLLKAQGVTSAWLLQSRVFRAQALQQKIVQHNHPAALLQAELQEHRDSVIDRVGPRRRLGVIFARALDEPNALVPRNFEAAVAHLQKAKARLDKDPFDFVAAVESDDPATKARGGDLGWFQRSDSSLPANVISAAFAMQKDRVSEPLRGRDGCYLVKVLAIDPEFSDAQLLSRLRERYVLEVTPQILASAEIRHLDGSLLGEEATAPEKNK